MTLLEAAKLMAKSFHSRNFTSLEMGLRYLHQHHPDHCGGKHDPFDALRPCSCSVNQLISAVRHGQEALEAAIHEADPQYRSERNTHG